MDPTRSFSHAYGCCQYHVVLVPYKRFKMFARADIKARLEAIFLSIAIKHRFEVKAQEVMEDHVHLFVNILPSQSISQVIQLLKGSSSRQLRLVFPELDGYSQCHLWSAGKFFRPISEVNEETIKHYIESSQKKHHPDNTPTKAWLQKMTPEITTPQRSLNDFSS
jgi:putative transposase